MWAPARHLQEIGADSHAPGIPGSIFPPDRAGEMNFTAPHRTEIEGPSRFLATASSTLHCTPGFASGLPLALLLSLEPFARFAMLASKGM